MTAPSLRSLGTATVGSTNAPSFAEPLGAQANDIIEIKFSLEGTNSVTGVPTGFAAPGSAPQVSPGGTHHALQVYWGRRSSVGAGPYTFTLASSTHVEGRAAAIQDAITTGNPYEATGGATSAATTATAPAVSATSTGPDRYASYGSTNWFGGAWTPPSGFTEQWESTNRIITFDDKSLPTAQTVTPQAVCASTDWMTAWVGILLPVPSGSSVSADASLTATAVVSSTAAVTRPAAAAISGTGTIAAGAAVTRPAAASLTATGTVTTAATATRPGSAALTGTVAITAASALTASGQAAVAAVATVTASAAVTPPGGNITLRPDTGTTARPSAGITARPFTGITVRP